MLHLPRLLCGAAGRSSRVTPELLPFRGQDACFQQALPVMPGLFRDIHPGCREEGRRSRRQAHNRRSRYGDC